MFDYLSIHLFLSDNSHKTVKLFLILILIINMHTQHNRLMEMGFKEEWVIAAMGASNNDEAEAMRILLQQH